mgnify:FL=1
MTTRQEAIDGVNRLFGEIAPCGCMECAPLRAAERAAVKPTIPLRIRVGVTADGKWSAFGRSIGGTAGHMSPTDVVGEDIGDHGPIVAWHWVRAEVPMPETEQGDVAGTVEQPCAGMPSDQKGSR